ncbi:glycosyltransferase [Candidatus Aerophobetes bacterium]|nr:glycosyltransferase [Candidatus Aerophobetes bacterium]
MRKMRVLVGVCSWGLGHAVRILPLVRKILEKEHSVSIVGYGRSLVFLKKELGTRCTYFEVPDYMPVYSEKAFSVARFVGRFPVYLGEIVREHRKIRKIVEQDGYERIISDSRFGIYHPEIPSFLIFHQLRFIAPGRIKIFEKATEGFNYFVSHNFDKFIVPDFKEERICLSGDLSHNLSCFKENKVEYVGILCDLKRRDLPQDIDYFISISGPEPQRTIFEKKVFSQLSFLKGKTVVALGKPEEKKKFCVGNATVFSHLDREKQEEIMNRSRLIITRPGYTTLMELAILGKKALLVPTPGQTEQIYLATYHMKKGNFYSVSQEKLNLVEDVKEAEKYPGIRCDFDPGQTVENLLRVIFSG